MRFIALAAALISVPALAHEELAALSAQDRHLTCLTQAIYYEARGQSRAGQIAVGQVVLNRTRDRRFHQTYAAWCTRGETTNAHSPGHVIAAPTR